MGTIGPIVSGEERYSTINGVGCRTYTMTQRKYQSVPRNFETPLPYERRLAEARPIGPVGTRMNGGNLPIDAANFGARELLDRSADMVARCGQTAYGRLVGQIKEDAMGWGENLATRKQSFDMMLHRVGTLVNAVRKLKKGDIPGFARALGVTQKPSKSRLKNLSSTWLEYHFGWEPLYGDIYNVCKSLSSDLPCSVIRAVGREEATWHSQRLVEAQQNTVRVIVKYQGTYYVDNPNKFLLNRLGVINPVSVAWELVPFSFAVDWFIPIGQYLQSYTDFWGVGRKDEFTTVYRTASRDAWYVGGYPDEEYYRIQSKGADTYRSLGISVPKPTFKLFKGFSLVRGATAIALLTGMLRSLG